jgi:hypothetical protein
VHWISGKTHLTVDIVEVWMAQSGLEAVIRQGKAEVIGGFPCPCGLQGHPVRGKGNLANSQLAENPGCPLTPSWTIETNLVATGGPLITSAPARF